MYVIFDQGAINTIRDMNPSKFAREKGGIILGEIFSEYLLVKELAKPSIFDKSFRLAFIRNRYAAQIKIIERWLKTRGKVNYLGEWHLHFENDPSPSIVDRELVMETYAKSKLATNFFIMVIIGYQTTYVALWHSGSLVEEYSCDFQKTPYSIITTIHSA